MGKSKQSEGANRSYQRRKLLAAGLPVPPEFEKRSGRKTTETEEEFQERRYWEKKETSLGTAKRYRESHRAEINQRTQARRDGLQDAILPYKQKPCTDCNVIFPPVCMDFDHKERSEKIDAVATMVTQCQPLDVILKEIAKCDLVCSNCHRIRTYEHNPYSRMSL